MLEISERYSKGGRLAAWGSEIIIIHISYVMMFLHASPNYYMPDNPYTIK